MYFSQEWGHSWSKDLSCQIGWWTKLANTVDAFVVYWLKRATLELKGVSSNPIEDTTSSESFTSSTYPMIILRGQSCWVLYADGIQLQLLCGIGFWTSLVWNCLNCPPTLAVKA